MNDADGCDPIIVASDDGVILGDGGGEIRCPDCGHGFDRDAAASAFFDGEEARYQCPECGRWSEGPPPGN